MKRLLKWFGIALLVFTVAVVIFLLSLDSILRSAAENRIYAQTGMQAEIGQFHLGLLEPVVTIKDLKLHNPPEFGGTPFLNVSEIHVEYDRDALLKNELHLRLARVNIGEFDIVKNDAGKTNVLALGLKLPANNKAANNQLLVDFKRSTGMTFKGIDVLNLSVGNAKFIDLKNPANNREQKIGIENQVVKNIQSPVDLVGVAMVIAVHGGDFFFHVFGSGINGK